MLKNLSRIEISEFIDTGKTLIDSASVEGVYISKDETSLEIDLFDDLEVQAGLRLTARGYYSLCSFCGVGLCRHIAALLICYRNEKDSFESVGTVKSSFTGLKVHKFELPSKAKKTSKPLTKKFIHMLNGLNLASDLLLEVLKTQSAGEMQALQSSVKSQLEKLKGFYLGGLQIDFLDLLQSQSFQKADAAFLVKVNELFQVIKQAKVEFEQAIEGELCEMPYSVLTARCGYVWKYEELAKLFEPRETFLIQLSFSVSENLSAQRLEENGIWLDLISGNVYLSQNLRPFKALRYISETNTEFRVLRCSGLVEYPGDYNCRVRWRSDLRESLGQDDIAKAYSMAKKFDASEFTKIKASFRDGLSRISPHAFLRVDRFSLTDDGVTAFLGDFEFLLSSSYETEALRAISLKSLRDVSCLFRFELSSEGVDVTPLCLVSEDSITRLGF